MLLVNDLYIPLLELFNPMNSILLIRALSMKILGNTDFEL